VAAILVAISGGNACHTHGLAGPEINQFLMGFQNIEYTCANGAEACNAEPDCICHVIAPNLLFAVLMAAPPRFGKKRACDDKGLV
jgi:hypothetical protein